MPPQGDDTRLEELRAQYLSNSDPSRAVPADLLQSWQRSQAALGVPANVRAAPQVDENLLDNHLLDMLAAPLARVAEDLDGSGMGLLLADAEGRILQRWTHDRSAVSYLDRLGTVRGAVLAEDAVGTNGVGTAIASGKSVLIAGAEHFADIYQGAACTGAPVWHPITGRLLAVVTISTTAAERSGLLLPLTNSVAARLEQHVVDVAQPAAKAMLAAFLDASTKRPGPVVAFGPDGLTMRNQRAAVLTQTDIDLVAHRCVGARRAGRLGADLSIGPVTIDVTPLDDGAGVVAVVDPTPRSTTGGQHARPAGLVGKSRPWLAALHHVGRHVGSREPLLLAGEPGVGKTSLALGSPYAPGSDPVGAVVVHAAERQILGNREWLHRLSDRLGSSAPVVVRGAQELDDPSLAAVRALVEKHYGHTPVLLTMTADARVGSEALAARLGIATLWVPPLRERTADIALLWQAFVAKRAPGSGLVLTGEARNAAEGFGWPGNLSELRSVVDALASAGKRGPVRLEDLPDAIGGRPTLSMIERTELDAIRRALLEAGGNRSKAAEILGVSRATIHRKMKAYRISG